MTSEGHIALGIRIEGTLLSSPEDPKSPNVGSQESQCGVFWESQLRLWVNSLRLGTWTVYRVGVSRTLLLWVSSKGPGWIGR